MRSAPEASSVVRMTAELFIASLDHGGASMMGVLLAIGFVWGLVYVASGRRRSDRGRESDRSREE
jgi:hypothetical protein